MTANIITTYYFDRNDDSFNYQLYFVENQQKRTLYWKACIAYFATSRRFNPEANHILYTNDDEAVIAEGFDVKGFLTENLGVDIRILPFLSFKIDKRLNKFHYPTLYIFEAIKAISREFPGAYHFLHDADCVWVDAAEKIIKQIDVRKPLLYDIYQIAEVNKMDPHGLSRKALGDFYKKIDPDYPIDAPVHFGGEIIGGTSETFRRIYEELNFYIEKCLANPDNLPVFPSGAGIFDGDEFLTSMVYNKIFPDYELANRFIKRIWTGKKVNNVRKEDLNLIVWHLIAEKPVGLPYLYREIIDKHSPFWTTPVEELKFYLGSFFGIPDKRLPGIAENRYLLHKIYFKLKKMFRI